MDGDSRRSSRLPLRSQYPGNTKQSGKGLSDKESTYHHGDLRRALIDAALSLVREEQDWTFSLREVARRAGVSHNAPYNHFADKQDLLSAITVAGFQELRDRLQKSTACAEDAEQALIKSGIAYIKFGVGNAAHYRLMFASALVGKGDKRPPDVIEAAAGAKNILVGIIESGARAGIFAISPDNAHELQNAVLFAWGAVHGLTMLAIDGRGGPALLKTDKIAEKLVRTLCHGLLRR